ncbi:hypothetical protein ACGGAQ_22985 [Micromonospora sp. NPDC047557]|uniref:hypothetical protein n=1 Tax=Micromonospora sp. NPDC047557 TaxID=3364250 RepID=UPI003720DE1A
MDLTGPGTIDDLVTDARAEGYQATTRLITDWVSLGLLDQPRRQPRGRGLGSSKGLYAPHQRRLFLTLLAKRAEVSRVTKLAPIPVFIWLYWGDEFVPLRQARRALMTWLKANEVSNRKRAREQARLVLGQLDHPATASRARRELVDAMAEVAYTGRADPSRLEAGVRGVFEPDGVRRELGHPAAPLTVESVLRLIDARLAAVSALKAEKVTDSQFAAARQAHLMAAADYAATQRELATQAPPHLTNLYEPLTIQSTFDSCCIDLLSIVGLQLSSQPSTSGTVTDSV